MRSQLARLSPKAMPKNVVSPTRAIHWIFDWDGTLTKRDTLDALVHVAHHHKPDADVPGIWKQLTQAYLCDYEASMETLCPGGQLPATVVQEKALLKQLEEVEQRSIDRVSGSGVFRGLTAEVVGSGAIRAISSARVQLRAGCPDLLRFIQTRASGQPDDRDVVDVLSVNWSQRFIGGCLRASVPELIIATPSRPALEIRGREYGATESQDAPALVTGRGRESAGSCSMAVTISVYSNELQGIGRGQPSTGVLCADDGFKIISSADKLTLLQRLQKPSPHSMKPMPIVYVGDSWTDLECLLAAELGICIRDDPMTWSQEQVKKALDRLGIQCPHIGSVEDVDQWSVVWARDFVEIQNWVQECQASKRN